MIKTYNKNNFGINLQVQQMFVLDFQEVTKENIRFGSGSQN